MTLLNFPYNGILGRPALGQFMAASHYGYNTLKMPGPVSVISIPSDKKDTSIYVDKMYRDAVAIEAAEATVRAKENNNKKKANNVSSEESRKRASLECATPVDDLPKSSNNKSSKVTAPQVKKVLAGLAGVDGTFTISSILYDKQESTLIAFLRANIDVFVLWRC